ncbi:MAG TPA: ATP-binding protein [Polyangiaceae bacterium]|jgi:hypothetical protein
MSHKTATTLRFDSGPPERLASTVREFVGDLYGKVLLDEDATSRVALAAHELLENLAKYSSAGETSIDIELAERAGQSFIRIRTRNSSTPERIATLREVLDEIHDAADPTALYYDFLTRSAKRQDASGLGLARIRAEAEMELKYHVVGDQVTIEAETPVEAKRDP